MKLRKRLRSSLRPLFTHRLRAALAIAGVAAGVAAVIVARAVGTGARAQMVAAIERMGTNLLIVKPLAVRRLVARPQISGAATSLRIEDAVAIGQLPLIGAAVPAFERPARVKLGRTAVRATVRGTSPGFPAVRGFARAAGRRLDETDEREARRVAVLGASVAREFGEPRTLIGRELRIAGVPYEIVGVLAPKGATIEGADQDYFVVVPLQTALRRVFNSTWLTNVYASVTDPARMNEAENEIQHLLRTRHLRGRDDRADDFAVQDTTKTRAFQEEMTESVSRYASGLAAIALGIGGTGILALMLLSVRERTGEIGLRMAVGAGRRDILYQFLIESATLALLGWATGAALGGLAALGIAWGTTWPVGVPVSGLVTTLAMALLIGIGFGVVPARNAARIPPIVALARP